METLKNLRNQIKMEVPYIDIKPYSHNIISLTLSTIAKNYGYDEANKAITDFGLESRGWKHENKDE